MQSPDSLVSIAIDQFIDKFDSCLGLPSELATYILYRIRYGRKYQPDMRRKAHIAVPHNDDDRAKFSLALVDFLLEVDPFSEYLIYNEMKSVYRGPDVASWGYNHEYIQKKREGLNAVIIDHKVYFVVVHSIDKLIRDPRIINLVQSTENPREMIQVVDLFEHQRALLLEVTPGGWTTVVYDSPA